MKILFLCFFVLFLSLGCSTSSVERNKEVVPITTESVFSMIDQEDVYIIDVREDYEYASGHIKNAYNIPLSNIHEIQKLFIELDSTIIVYCRTGVRSRKAAEILLDLGYQNVFDMGGIDMWNYELISDGSVGNSAKK